MVWLWPGGIDGNCYIIPEECVNTIWLKQLDATQSSSTISDSDKVSLKAQEAKMASCSSIPQRQIADRTVQLEKAVLAHVPRAAWYYFAAGPNGQPLDLLSRPDDLGVAAWRTKAVEYLKAEAEAGGQEAIMQLSSIYSGEIEKYYGYGEQWNEFKNLGLGLGYALVLRDIKILNNKKVFSLEKYIAMIQSWGSEADMQAAKEFEATFMAKCCQK